MTAAHLSSLRLFQRYWNENADSLWKSIIEAAKLYESIERDPGLERLFDDLEKASQMGLIVDELSDDSPVWDFWEWGRRIVPHDVEILKAHYRE